MSATTKDDDNLQSWLEAMGLDLYEKAMVKHKEGKVWEFMHRFESSPTVQPTRLEGSQKHKGKFGTR